MRNAALTIAAALVAAAPALAEPGEWKAAEVTVFVGADIGYLVPVSTDWTLDDSTGRSVFELGDGSGWAGSVVVGAEIARDFAVMLEGQILEAEQDFVSEAGSATVKSGSSEITFMGAFLTGHYRLPVPGRFRPYLGAGVGMGMLDVEHGDSDTAFAVKGVAGLDVAVAQASSVYGEYNYIVTTPEKIKDGKGASLEADLNTSLFRIGLRHRF